MLPAEVDTPTGRPPARRRTSSASAPNGCASSPTASGSRRYGTTTGGSSAAASSRSWPPPATPGSSPVNGAELVQAGGQRSPVGGEQSRAALSLLDGERSPQGHTTRMTKMASPASCRTLPVLSEAEGPMSRAVTTAPGDCPSAPGARPRPGRAGPAAAAAPGRRTTPTSRHPPITASVTGLTCGRPDGRPQCGHATASVETAPAQSTHVVSGTDTPPSSVGGLSCRWGRPIVRRTPA